MDKTRLAYISVFIFFVGALVLLGCTSTPESTPISPTPAVTTSDNADQIVDMAFSPDNKLLAAVTACGDVALFGLETETGGIFSLDETKQDTFVQFASLPHMMAFTTDSKMLVLSSKGDILDETCFKATDDLRWSIGENTVSSWGFASGTNVGSPGLTFPDGVNFTIVPDSDSASVAGRSDGHAYVWEMGTSEALMNLSFEELNSIDATSAFSPDTTIKAVASGQDIILERTTDNQVWHVLQGGSKGGHQSQITAIMFSRDGNTFFSASEDGQIISWAIDIAIRQYFPDSPPEDMPLIWNKFSVDRGITSLELNFDQSILAIGYGNGSINIASISGLNRP